MIDDAKPAFRFREVEDGSVDTELTQWDQFNSDELDAAEAVSRESHQNTLDASDGSGPVRTRISVHDADVSDGDYFDDLFSPLAAHLEASGSRFRPASFRRPRFLVVEDFGTTGLTGAWDKKDKGNFSDFWRRFGGSHKSGSKGGSWGLGKLAYPATSIARTFFGVTIRKGDPQALLMGQTVLRHHEIGDKQYVPFGFYSTLADSGLQLPITDQDAVARFSQAVGFKRKDEPGLEKPMGTVWRLPRLWRRTGRLQKSSVLPKTRHIRLGIPGRKSWPMGGILRTPRSVFGRSRSCPGKSATYSSKRARSRTRTH